MRKKIILFLMTLFAFSCDHPKKHEMAVGIDPLFYELNMPNLSPFFNGYVFDLLKDFSKSEKSSIQKVQLGWDQMLASLQLGQVDVIISSLDPTPENQTWLKFSDPILELGPVLLVKKDQGFKNLTMLDGKIVGVSATSEGFILAQNIPNVIIHPYEDMISAFLDLELGSIDGLIMPILQAVKINKNLFNDQFKIVSAPLTHKALRLVTLKGKNEHFIDTFNHYFRKVEIASSLKNLKQKWDLID